MLTRQTQSRDFRRPGARELLRYRHVISASGLTQTFLHIFYLYKTDICFLFY
jgi:hypothetical protein